MRKEVDGQFSWSHLSQNFHDKPSYEFPSRINWRTNVWTEWTYFFSFSGFKVLLLLRRFNIKTDPYILCYKLPFITLSCSTKLSYRPTEPRETTLEQSLRIELRTVFRVVHSKNFSIYIILPAALGPGGYSASNRNEYQKQKNVYGE
jgi:hypothetical protein